MYIVYIPRPNSNLITTSRSDGYKRTSEISDEPTYKIMFILP